MKRFILSYEVEVQASNSKHASIVGDEILYALKRMGSPNVEAVYVAGFELKDDTWDPYLDETPLVDRLADCGDQHE